MLKLVRDFIIDEEYANQGKTEIVQRHIMAIEARGGTDE